MEPPFLFAASAAALAFWCAADWRPRFASERVSDLLGLAG
jgi:hypothetical protein